ncbi:hypothetical protein [Chamaesiphon sp. VAR_69_metabat_338]|nr:hypothetical protein [Chamaesiphon sp. VAR_69_metabat_338]
MNLIDRIGRNLLYRSNVGSIASSNIRSILYSICLDRQYYLVSQ